MVTCFLLFEVLQQLCVTFCGNMLTFATKLGVQSANEWTALAQSTRTECRLFEVLQNKLYTSIQTDDDDDDDDDDDEPLKSVWLSTRRTR